MAKVNLKYQERFYRRRHDVKRAFLLCHDLLFHTEIGGLSQIYA